MKALDTNAEREMRVGEGRGWRVGGRADNEEKGDGGGGMTD